MPPERDHAHLWDMLEAARSVLEFVGARTRSEYLSDPLLQAAVERKVEIIGEAARKVSDEFRKVHPDIRWRGIIGQRNILAHRYAQIDHQQVWDLVTVHIPELIEKLERLIPPAPQDR